MCVGLQVLFEASDESPHAVGLAVLPGRVGRFPDAVRVPQFGWNRVEPEPGCRLIEPGYAYFANSYRVLEAPGCAVATAEHGGRFVAALERDRRARLPVPPRAVGRVRSRADRPLAGGLMLTARIIPCLDVSHGRVVKGIRFQGLRDAGDPAERAALYERQGADEIVILDVSATPEGRGNQVETVQRVRARLGIPLTVGGGIRTIDDAARPARGRRRQGLGQHRRRAPARAARPRSPSASAASAPCSRSTPRAATAASRC